MATSSSKAQTTPTRSPQQQGSSFEPMDKSTSSTLKRNPKMELSRADLLKLLSYLEGELQARDVVIATLKTEKVKHLLLQAKYGHFTLNDPYAALQRDSYAAVDPKVDEASIRALAKNQMDSLENLIRTQRRAQLRMVWCLTEAEKRHSKLVRELEEEKRKHEHDTAQGDDITYGLEKERTWLKQELEVEKQTKKKVEKEMKKMTEMLEEERNRQKQIVLLLLGERKKIIMKYIEERKRSEDLAQILTEEKGRMDSMAEGLEEESKKSLQMEAELEKQLAQFDTERQQMRGLLAKEEKRYKELEAELEKVKAEADHLKKQLAEAHQVAMFQANTAPSISPPRIIMPRPISSITPPQPPAKPSVIPPQTPPRLGQVQGAPLTPPKVGPRVRAASPGVDGSVSPPLAPPSGSGVGVPLASSVTKVVQPTATVSSVPVCGPTTGIARSVSPGQGLRNIVYTMATSEARTIDQRTTSTTKSLAVGDQMAWTNTVMTPGSETQSPQVPVEKSIARITPNVERSQPQVVQVSPRVSVSASPGTKVFTTTQGGKVTFHVTTNASTPSTVSGSSQVVPQPPKKPVPLGRGVPPPVPPNKPVVPPKKEVVTRTVVQANRSEVSVDPGQPISFEVKPQKVGPQGVRFGITISKDKIKITNPQGASNDLVVSQAGLNNTSISNTGNALAIDGSQPIRRTPDPQVGALPARDMPDLAPSPVEGRLISGSSSSTADSVPSFPASSSSNSSTEATPVTMETRNASVVSGGARRDVASCDDNVARPDLHDAQGLDLLGQELADFQQLLVSMASGSIDIAPATFPSSLSPALAASSLSPTRPSSTPSATPIHNTSNSLTAETRPEKTPNGSLPIHAAAQSNNLQVLCSIIKSSENSPTANVAGGGLLSERDMMGRTPLFLALTHGHEETARFLLQHGSPLFVITENGDTILHAAIQSGKLSCVDLVLNALSSEASRRNIDQLFGSRYVNREEDSSHLFIHKENQKQNCDQSVNSQQNDQSLTNGQTKHHLEIDLRKNSAISCVLEKNSGQVVTLEANDKAQHSKMKEQSSSLYSGKEEPNTAPQLKESTVNQSGRENDVKMNKSCSGGDENSDVSQDPICENHFRTQLTYLCSVQDQNGCSALHLAAAKEEKIFLEHILSRCSDFSLELRDKAERTVYDVASPACKHYLDSVVNLHHKDWMCSVWMVGVGSNRGFVAGTLCVTPNMKWPALEECLYALAANHWETLSRTFIHTRKVSGKKEQQKSDPSHETHSSDTCLGLSRDSILHFELGQYKWKKEEAGTATPFEVLSNNETRDIHIVLVGGNRLDALAYETLIPVAVLQNYVRLVEQYKGVVFYGPKLVGKTSLAKQIANYLSQKHQMKDKNCICTLDFSTVGVTSAEHPDISQTPVSCDDSVRGKEKELGQSLNSVDSQSQGNSTNVQSQADRHKPSYVLMDGTDEISPGGIMHVLVRKNCLLPSGISTEPEPDLPIFLLDNLSKEVCSGILGDFLKVLSKRSSDNCIKLSMDGVETSYYVSPSAYIIATMDTPRSTGIDLMLQQQFRWVHLRLDQEPVRGQLGRHMIRQLIQACGGYLPSPVDPVYCSVEWLCSVWSRLNECLLKLGFVNCTYGPYLFTGCPIEAGQPRSILRWVTSVWNTEIAPAVTAAVVASSQPPPQKVAQVVNMVLMVILQRVIAPSCPLSGSDKESYIGQFKGGSGISTHPVSRKSRSSWSGVLATPLSPISKNTPSLAHTRFERSNKRFSDPSSRSSTYGGSELDPGFLDADSLQLVLGLPSGSDHRYEEGTVTGVTENTDEKLDSSKGGSNFNTSEPSGPKRQKIQISQPTAVTKKTLSPQFKKVAALAVPNSFQLPSTSK